jgi:chemotaxis protein methyltransferase CheR
MAELTPELHAIWSGFLRDRLGLHYGFDDRAVLGDKLSTRAVDAGFDSLLDYYYHLRYDDEGGAELAALGDALVVNESYLFRERAQLEVIVERLAQAIAAGGRPRVWSAACAAGEEPLTLAMMLDHRGLLAATRIVATDLSTRALARAQQGSWSRRALRYDVDAAIAERYLQVDDRSVRIAPALVQKVEWQRINLIDDAQVARMTPCDVILCRNVLIYFDDETVVRVVRSLASRLLPGGALFVGVSESLMRFDTGLVCEDRRGVFFYRRPER